MGIKEGMIEELKNEAFLQALAELKQEYSNNIIILKRLIKYEKEKLGN